MTIIIVSTLVVFRNVLKLLKSFLHIRRANLQKKLTAGRLVYFPIYLKFMKDLCMITLMMLYKNFSAASGKAVITVLSKTLDYISHELLIAKINAYGFVRKLLK